MLWDSWKYIFCQSPCCKYNFSKNHVPTKKQPPPPIPTFCNISRQIPFSFQFSSSKIIILWFCLNSRWIRCLILVSRSREHPPAVLYTQIVRAHPISAKIHESEAVYFLISNDVSGICSRYIILV